MAPLWGFLIAVTGRTDREALLGGGKPPSRGQASGARRGSPLKVSWSRVGW